MNETDAGRKEIERGAHRQGLELDHSQKFPLRWHLIHSRPAAPVDDQEIAAMKFSEFDTQPNMAPCALIISSPTRWNSGKYEATQSLSTTHS